MVSDCSSRVLVQVLLCRVVVRGSFSLFGLFRDVVVLFSFLGYRCAASVFCVGVLFFCVFSSYHYVVRVVRCLEQDEVEDSSSECLRQE